LLYHVNGSFEVTVNGTVAFSKLDRGAFPDFQEVAEVVQKAESSGEVMTVQQTTSSCTIL